MYQKIYHWVSGSFYPISIGILLLLLLLEAAGIHGKKSRTSKVLWKSAFFLYLFLVLFLTLGSRMRTGQRHLNLHFHWEMLLMAFQGKAQYPWEDLANIILFLPFGIFFQEIFGKKWLYCILSGAWLSMCIELAQLLTGCGYCDINDFFSNVLGTAGGYFWSCVAMRIKGIIGKNKETTG